MGMVTTVLGPVAADSLGRTLMHEHCLTDTSSVGTYAAFETEDEELRDFLTSEIALENRGRMPFYWHKHAAHLKQTDEALAIRELGYFKRAGGGALVDVTPEGIGRDAEALRRISRATGLHIVASTGLYVEESHPAWARNMDKRALTAYFLGEIERGIGETGVKPGYIGEIGISDDWTERELLVLAAAGAAQAESGLGLTVHQPIFQTWGERILDILAREGCDLTRVALSHCDPTLENRDYHRNLLERGATVQFDQFALEFPVTYGPYVKRWLPRDIDRIRAIKRLMDDGWEDQLTVSMDLCFRANYRAGGGPGYAYLIGDLYPYFLHEGITEAQMEKLLVKNPLRLLEAR